MDGLGTPAECNASRFARDDPRGYYESYFVRANHPQRPLAFWIRYTRFCPRGRPQEAVGELWAIGFDGERGRTLAAKQVLPVADCSFSAGGLDVRVGDARLDGQSLVGEASGPEGAISWDLRYAGDAPPLLLLPPRLYAGGFPKAKALVPRPSCRFDGSLTVAGERIAIDGWVGSQNHNWGLRHTDQYAWGQVAGFDDAPDAFLELSTARVKLGPLWTPFITLAVLRLDGEEHRFDSLTRGARADAHFDYFDWSFAVEAGAARLSGRLQAPREAFVSLRYDNPPGGMKTCLNTKIASCALALQRPGRPVRTLRTGDRAAFEILTDDQSHGLPHRA